MRGSGEPAVPRSVLVTALFAVIVTVTALGVVYWQRTAADRAEAAGAAAAASSTEDCGGPCTVIATTGVGGETAELLVGPSGHDGQVRFGGATSATVIETSIGGLGATLNSTSLSCVDGAKPACLVRGPHEDGVVGEVLALGGDGWQVNGRPYLSDAGAVMLRDIAGDSAAEVAVVRHDCSRTGATAACQKRPVLVEVFDVGGGSVGCTRTYGSAAQVPGWPDVKVRSGNLRRCP